VLLSLFLWIGDSNIFHMGLWWELYLNATKSSPSCWCGLVTSGDCLFYVLGTWFIELFFGRLTIKRYSINDYPLVSRGIDISMRKISRNW